MKKEFTGTLVQGEFTSQAKKVVLKKRELGGRFWADGYVENDEGLFGTLMNPRHGTTYRFHATTGEEFDLVIAGSVDLFSPMVRVQSSGRVPGLLE